MLLLGGAKQRDLGAFWRGEVTPDLREVTEPKHPEVTPGVREVTRGGPRGHATTEGEDTR